MAKDEYTSEQQEAQESLSLPFRIDATVGEKALCRWFGHRYRLIPGRSIADDIRCQRCGDVSPGVVWPDPPSPIEPLPKLTDPDATTITVREIMAAKIMAGFIPAVGKIMSDLAEATTSPGEDKIASAATSAMILTFADLAVTAADNLIKALNK